MFKILLLLVVYGVFRMSKLRATIVFGLVMPCCTECETKAYNANWAQGFFEITILKNCESYVVLVLPISTPYAVSFLTP